MPFGRKVRVEVVNGSRAAHDALLPDRLHAAAPSCRAELGVLHVTFRRENPTTLRRDFVIADGFRGPGRFLGCNVGVRVIDPARWYGEGEVKVFRDGDTELPTICGTGLEDYVGSAWGLGAHAAPYGGAPLEHRRRTDPARARTSSASTAGTCPTRSCSSASCGSRSSRSARCSSRPGRRPRSRPTSATNPVAGEGWLRDVAPGLLAWGIAERVDDYCATAFVYCREPQPVPRLDLAAALADIERKDYESVNPQEALQGVIDPSAST